MPGPGLVRDAAGAAERGVEVPILPGANVDGRARSSRPAKLEGPRILGPARLGMAEWNCGEKNSGSAGAGGSPAYTIGFARKQKKAPPRRSATGR
jgi:hypothetical protein